MADRRALPAGITPRLLTRDQAAAYCGIVADTFEDYIRPHVPPIDIGARRLWDIRALDRWLDARSGLVTELRPIGDWLKGLGGDAEADLAGDGRAPVGRQ